MYYKIYKDNKVLDAISNPYYFKRIPNGKTTACPRAQAEGLLSSNQTTKWYINTWVKRKYDGILYSIVEITEAEYNLLHEAFVQQDQQPDPVVQEPTISLPETTSLTIQESKIKLMNKACSEKIVEGVDVVLSDGIKYHFDLTIEDQINLLSLQNLVDNGATEVPYHSKGKEATMFSKADIKIVLEAVTQHRLYHITYVNVLKHYIQSLQDLDKLAGIYYGMPIPEEYQTEAFKSLLK